MSYDRSGIKILGSQVINLRTTGPQTPGGFHLYNPPPGINGAIVVGASVILLTLTGTLLGVGTASIGTAGGSYIDIIPLTALTNMTSLGPPATITSLGSNGNGVCVVNGYPITWNQSVAFNCTTATALVQLLGYEF